MFKKLLLVCVLSSLPSTIVNAQETTNPQRNIDPALSYPEKCPNFPLCKIKPGEEIDEID